MPQPAGSVSTEVQPGSDINSEQPLKRTGLGYGHQKVDVFSPKSNQFVPARHFLDQVLL